MNFIDKYFFTPNWWQKIIIFLLFPFSVLYAFISFFNNRFRKKIYFDIPIISLGNLSVGGNGKTPVAIAICEFLKNNSYENIFVILRGYKRKKEGTFAVKINDKILCDVKDCGDEAYEYALFSNASVIVSKNREEGINLAQKMGAKIVILDDAFSKIHIKKYDILVFSSATPKYPFCLPSGAYRLPLFCKKYANFCAYENKDFFKNPTIKNMFDENKTTLNQTLISQNTILISTIAKPFRLDEFKKYAKAVYFLGDHAQISKEFIDEKLRENNAKTILCTQKDYVKIKDFGYDIYLITLKTILEENFKKAILNYLKNYKNDKQKE